MKDRILYIHDGITLGRLYKVPLFLCLVAPIRRYGHFLNFMFIGQNEKQAISQLAQGPKMTKMRPLSLFKL